MSLSLSHTDPRPATANDPTASGDRIERPLCELRNELRDLSEHTPPQQDFESFERAVHERFVAAKREVLASELQRLDVDVPAVTIGRAPLPAGAAVPLNVPERGPGRSAWSARCTEPATNRRSVALEGACGDHRRALVRRLAARQASVLVARMTPQESADTLSELGNMSPSKSTLDRLPKHLSSRWEEDREAFEEAVRATTVSVPAEARTVAVSLDGGDGADEGRGSTGQASGGAGQRGRATKGPARLPGGRVWDGVVLRRGGGAVEHAADRPDAGGEQGDV